MNAKEFVKQFYLEKMRLLETAFDSSSEWHTAAQIKALNLDKEQTEKVRNIVSGLLTDTFYTILLGLDGSAAIGDQQTAYTIMDEDGNELSGGDIEVHAYEYFHGHKLEVEGIDADFVATLTYKNPEESGRKTPVSSGYRAQIRFPFSEMETSGRQEFINRQMVFPGDTLVDAAIKMSSAELFTGQLKCGTKFEVREGAIIIATGEVTQILNEALRKTSR